MSRIAETFARLKSAGRTALMPYLMVGFPGPHCPYDPAPEFLEGLDPGRMPDAVPDAGDTPGIREQAIRGNLEPWNGVDYTEFTPEHKRKIRLHYAALVRQIDYVVGRIVESLAEQGLAENTVIVFSSDHGDYLGDHNLIGKGHFYESSFHVPLIVTRPGASGSTLSDELVTLTDVTATLLGFAGVAAPAHMDSRPLPGVGLAGATGRDHIVGALGGGWMIQQGAWRLSHYATGESLLFNVEDDPNEGRNLIDEPGCRAIYRDLDAKLRREIMAMEVESHHPQRVYVHDLSQTDEFGREGWQRPTPRRIDQR
jgi:arylsulfatase A-like enzyme